MAGGRRDEIEFLLEKLHSCGLQDDQTDIRLAENVVVDIADHLSLDSSPVQFELYLSHLFGEKGIITFGRRAIQDKLLADAKKGTLDVISCLLSKNSSKILKYVEEIRKYCMFLYNVDKAAKVRTNALEVFSSLLEKHSVLLDLSEMKVDQFIERLCIDIRVAKGSTVLQQQLRILGMLLYCYPEQLSHHAVLILKMYKDQLRKHTGKTPDLIALAGVLRGLTLYLHHFPQGRDDDPKLYQELYGYVKKILNPDLNLPRRDAQRACMELLHTHGAKFSNQLFDDCTTIFSWLLKWCNHHNRDDHKAAVPAMDTFMLVIANILDLHAGEDDKKGKQVFKYLLQEYNHLLERNSGTSSVSLAVKGYGLLSGACVKYLSETEVNTMFNQVLAASQYTFYQSSEMLENKLSNFPSYIESLAIIISNMTMVNDVIIDSVLKLSLDLVEHFPQIAKPLTPLAYRAIFTLLHTVYNKQEYFHEFVHRFVYGLVLLTCSHAPEFEAVLEIENSAIHGGEKWNGLKNELTTYKSFLPLWKALLLPERLESIKVMGMPATIKMEISAILYSEFINCTLEITEKLDLETFKDSEIKMVYVNLESLFCEVLPLQSEAHLEKQVPRLVKFFVRQSLLQPLVSSHYSVITTVLTCNQHYFLIKIKEEPESATVTHLIRSYVIELLQRCRQYRDELLVSCLKLIMRLPSSIVTDIFPELVHPIQMALGLGVSYLPLAEACVKALQVWSRLLPGGVLRKYFPSIMPYLLPYLKSQESGGQAEVYTRVIAVKLAFARQRRKVDQKRMLESRNIDKTAMQRVQLAILRLVGSLDPELSLCIIPQDPEALAAAAVRWDTVKHIKFAVPFEQNKIDVYLDDLLPHVVDLAVNCSDRQTKVAASEVLHSIILLMIGTGAQQSRETRIKYPMAPLYKHIFKAMLKLSCDPDQAVREIFIKLNFQVIHWFTNNRNYENPDTVVLLDAVMEGIINPNDPAIRDISAQFLSEFTKWSCKNNPSGALSPNVKSVLKRLISFCNHPSAFKRLGGAMAWKSIYREFRENDKSVDIWTLELLVALLTSLELAQGDDPALGTHEQCLTAIKHIERILKERKEIFWKVSRDRRIPRELGEGLLEDLLAWLLNQCGKPKSILRHKCFELIVTFAPLLKGIPSSRVYVEHFMKSHGLNVVLDIIEGGGEAHLGIKYHPHPSSLGKILLLKDVVIFLEALSASLDGYTWFLGQGCLNSQELLGSKDVKVFHALDHFIMNVSTCTITEYMVQNNDGESILVTPTELQTATKLKCTVVIRVMDFMMLLLQNGRNAELNQLPALCSSHFFKMVTLCVMDPVKIGFDLKDVEVRLNLPSHLEEILSVLCQKLPEQHMRSYAAYLQEYIEDPTQDIARNLPSSLTEKSAISYSSKQNLEGLQILQKSGWLAKFLVGIRHVTENLTSWIERCLVKEGNLAEYPHPSYMELLNSVITFLFTVDPMIQHQFLTLATSCEVIFGHGKKHMQKGTHILSVLGSFLFPYFIKNFQPTMNTCMELINGDNTQNGFSFAATLLSFIRKNATLRHKYRVSVVKSFLLSWPTIVAAAGNLSSHHASVLDILSTLFLVDGENTIKKYVTSADSTIVTFYNGILTSQNSELQLKIKALKLLPFFLTLSPAVPDSVGDSLEIFNLNHFPLQSTEFTAGGAKDREYHQALNEILTALELSKSQILLKFITKLFCQEENHRYEETLQTSLEKYIRRCSALEQTDALKTVYGMFMDVTCQKQTQRQNIMDIVMKPLMQSSDSFAVGRFMVENIRFIMDHVSMPLSHKSEEQLKSLITKTGCFSILQLMYSKLPREKVFAPGSEINAAFRPSDESGKELTKEIIRSATKISKGEYRHNQTHSEKRRLCACAAYNCTIALLACVQNDLRFYTNLLFSENLTKDEAIWESIIDCSIKHEFDVEVNFKPGNKKRFTAVRSSIREELSFDDGGAGAGTVQYMASGYLSDSSLREDLSLFDFSNSVVSAISERGDLPGRKFSPMDLDHELVVLNLDRSDYNDHEVMDHMTAVIRHMVDQKIMALPPEGTTPAASEIPQWMSLIQKKLEMPETPRNVKLFLLRLMINVTDVFMPYAQHYVLPVLSCIADGVLGDSINYFLCDLLIMLMNWGKGGVPQDSILGRNLTSRVLLHLCKHTPHLRADIFKYNLEVTRAVVESWKNLLAVPYHIIYSLMETVDGKEREVEAGLHLLGIMIVNGLSPFNQSNEAEKSKCRSLLGKLMCSKMASVYSAAAELIGLVLKFLTSQYDDCSELEDIVVKRITDMMYERERQSQALNCVYYIHKHYAPIIRRFINKILNLLPKLYGIYRTRVMECIVSYSASMEDVFIHLKEQNLLETLTRKEPSTQLVGLQLVNSVMLRLQPSELLYFMPGITAFINHQAPRCREQMYDVLFWIYDNYNDSLEGDGSKLEMESRSILLQAVKDQDAILKQKVLNFWLEGTRSQALPHRLLHILQKIYSPESEDSFLLLATYILLEATSRSADYQRSIFDQPLTECKFWDMKVSTAWQARHASMIPMFAETQRTGSYSATQSSDIHAIPVEVGQILATQPRAFAETQATGGSYNWVTESTFDTTVADMEYQATHAPIHGAASGLLFSIGSSEKQDMLRFKTSGLGKKKMEAPTDDTPPDEASSTQSKLIRRRFVRNQDREKQSIHFAKIEERRRKQRDAVERMRRSRREAQVTMSRGYRDGEIPDIQIKHKELIAPLQTLAQCDNKTASKLFELLTQGVMDCKNLLMSPREAEDWHQRICCALNNIIASTFTCHTQLLKTILHLMINNDVTVNPEELSAACLESHLEPLGILVLERQVLVSQKGDLDAKPPLRKKLKTEVKESSDASLWLNMAELYRSLDMWDVVCGIVQEKLGNIKPETCRALEAEAINNPTQAFVQYRTALRKEEWEEEPSLTEKRIWEDWYLNCAGMLGQWSEMEKFLEERFLKDHDGHVEVSRVWNVARPTSVILPAMIQSKLMNILDGSDNDGNLFEFIKASMEDTHHRLLMENTFPLQMAVLAVYQEKMPRAEVYLNSTMSHTLHAISQYSILTPKPLKATLRNAQLLTELDDFLKASKQAISDADPFKVKKSIETWKNRNVNTGDNPVLIQCLASYRDLYLHHLDNQIELIPEEFNQVMRDIKVATHRAVVESSLQNFNYHLADRHLRKLKVISNDPYSLAQFYFLMTENHMLRAKNNPFKSLQYLVEAWARFMGKVSTMPVLNEAAVDAQYLRLESLLCYSICEAIDEMGYEWAPDSQYMRILADKFPTPQSKETWYTELLKCSFNSLIKAVDLTENQMLDDVEPNESSHKKVYRTLAKYCDDCLEKWENRINSFEYSKYLVIATLKGMMVGDTDAQYHFPRLINLLEENPLLIDTFKSYAEKVPTWMFLLWLNHILIYIDKAPGPALQPLIENLANEYPQAVVYPFGVSVQQYNLTTKTGKLALPICNRVKSVLNRNPLFQEFISSTSLVVAPYIECKDALRSLVEVECGKEEIEAKLKVIEETLFKVNVRSTRRTSFERGEAYIKLDRMRKLALEAVNKSFGENFKKLNSMSVKDIKEQLKVLYSLFKPTQEDQQNLPRQLKSYSPWLASFQASKYPDILELPGQYSGLSKPLPEYHVKISSFDDNLLLMKSMRVPVRITVRGDDERDYKFLVKWGEDLRTDQRMEQAFALMNAIYSSSPLCSNLTSRPSLDTYQVIPLSVQVGLLQWVEATMPLKDFISDSYKANEMKTYDSARETFGRVRPWEPSEKTRAKDIVKIYGEVVNMIPWDILRRGFVKLASDSTGFFSLRSAFAVSYATLCISHWILGIGDRHCSNSLINLKTGCVVGIDFGHHFESATQVLPFPELMPFRLSPQIVNVFQPVGASGMLKQIMIAALGSLRNSRQLLISFLEAFVKEPTDDWINFVRMLQGSTDDGQVELYSNERIRLLKAKLNGINPAHITSWALKQNRSMKRQPRVLSSLLEVIAGSNKNDLRSQLDADQLTSCQQVDILLSLACDPNILGRTWIGWDSFL